jgi:hypothetical protein
MYVYSAAILALVGSGNYQFAVLPGFIAALHYMRITSNVTSLTTSIEMNKLQKKNKEYKEVFENTKKLVLEHQPLREHFLGEDTYLLYNPHFEMFDFREKGLVEKLDQERSRFLYTCKIKGELISS